VNPTQQLGSQKEIKKGVVISSKKGNRRPRKPTVLDAKKTCRDFKTKTIRLLVNVHPPPPGTTRRRRAWLQKNNVTFFLSSFLAALFFETWTFSKGVMLHRHRSRRRKYVHRCIIELCRRMRLGTCVFIS
jgi:hypothetical protein